MLKREKKHNSGGKARGKENKDEELFVFGYASKLFRDDKAADFHDKEKHLISWQGDSSLQIDRYDCRLLFTDKSQFNFDPATYSEELSLQELEIEQLCDKERYLELTTNMEEYDIEQEEEMKRFKEAISQDSGYAAVGFSYNENDTDNSVDACDQPDNQVQGPSPQPVEKFVAPEELGVPDGMKIPDTAKMNAIIEKTAMFVSEQGTQMEILVKAKQAGNPQFDFLNFDNWLNPYYKHVLKSIKEKTYIPELVQSPKPEESQDSDPESDEDDSDGEFELHPLLTASHRSASNTPNSSAPSSPAPQPKEEHTNYNNSISRAGEHGHYNHGNGADSGHLDGYHWMGQGYDSYYHGNDYSGVAVSTHYMPTQPTSTATLAAVSLLPPPPPPPGEGPLEEEWLGNTSSPAPPPPIVHAVINSIPGIIPGHPVVMPTTVPIVPPPPDVQPVIDKLANYVAKNGNDFENIIKAKNDPRFTFVHTWHEHHRYYLYKKQLCVDELEKERKAAIAKGPVSFSIKPKEVQKPKIEYRTNVIYKQSVDPDESEDDEMKENEIEENGTRNRNEGNGATSRDVEKEDKIEDERPEKDVEEQMRSIQAAEKEAQRLEAESQAQREKQLQEERRRKASLFISMLKKTKGSEETPQDSETANSQEKRRFRERKRSSDTSVDMFEDKRPRNEEDEGVASSGAGAPPADIIRITQDLMAKVRAASRAKR